MLPVVSEGRPLQYYHDLVLNIVTGPVVLLLLVAIGYNVLVGIATWWMHENASSATAAKRRKRRELATAKEMQPMVEEEEDASDDLRDGVPVVSFHDEDSHTSIWEEIFVLNIKFATFLLGKVVKLQDFDHFVVLKIHDYAVHLPLAIIFIQVFQCAVLVVLLVIFIDALLIEVTHVCDPTNKSYDCYDANDFNMSSLPIDCNSLSADYDDIELTCLCITFNPILAIAITGGIAKVLPTLLFSLLTYSYLRLYTLIHKMVTMKYSRVISIIAAEFALVGTSIALLVNVLRMKPTSIPFSLHHVSFNIVNPLTRSRNIVILIAFIVISPFIWCVYPQSTSAVRYKDSKWKKEVTSEKRLQAKKKSAMKQDD